MVSSRPTATQVNVTMPMQRFKSPGSAQRVLNLQSATYNSFYFQRHLLDRTTFKRYRAGALNEWNAASTAA